MKSIAIQQPYIFPYLGYFQLMNLVDKFILLDDVNFIKKGWINRNRILGTRWTNDGFEPQLFSIPLNDISQNRHIRDTTLHQGYVKWISKFETTLQHTYRKAPYFTQTKNLVLQILNSCQARDSISRLCFESLKAIKALLALDCQLVQSSATYNNQSLKGQDRIINICQQEATDCYINLIGGQGLYFKEMFTNIGIDLKFHKCLPYSYSQGSEIFQANLSIIDTLMWCEPSEVKQMLHNCEVI